ncbi:FkbM family methyltransferase [Gaetbulibacter jejuensis]
MKKRIKHIIKKIGYTLVKNESFDKLTNHKSINAKGELLDSFFSLLKSLNFYPEAIYDIGANKGNWTFECLKYFPNATYYLFEPQQSLESDIKNLVGHYKNVHLYSVGVGDVNDDLNFTIHKRDDSCSYNYTEDEAKVKGFKQIKLPIVRLDSFVVDNNLKPPNLLKIDAEGLDLKVLEGGLALLSSVEVIMVEVAIVNPRMENTVLNVLNYLDDKGFKLFDITDINRPFSNNVLWLSEFVFIKKEGMLDQDYNKI